MGHSAAPETAELQASNWVNFMKWATAHGNMVLPIPNRAVIYAGYPPAELMKVKKSLSGDQSLRGMWQIIEDVEKQIRDVTGQVTYDKLNDVLRRLRSPLPVVQDTLGAAIGHTKKFSDMLSCAEALTSNDWKLLDKGDFKKVWDELSALYIRNSQGDVQIWEGRKLNYKRIDIGTTLIRRELVELLKRTDLPKKTLEAVVKMAKGYQNHYDGQKQVADDLVRKAEAQLKAGAKV